MQRRLPCILLRYLETQLVVNAYRSSRRRVFFFDCEGTLAPDQRRLAMIEKNGEQLFAAGTPPSAAVKACLQALISDSKNTVVILSGRDRTLLEDWFKELKGIGLCAEHGGSTGGSRGNVVLSRRRSRAVRRSQTFE